MQQLKTIVYSAILIGLIFLMSCGADETGQACKSDSDCPTSQYCALSGGVFFSSSHCSKRSNPSTEADTENLDDDTIEPKDTTDTESDTTTDTDTDTDTDTNTGTPPPAECTQNSDCDDNIECTTDACVDGFCQNIPDNTVCDDGNLCTDNHCDAAVGCETKNNNAPCDDGVFCNGADLCSNGTCTVHEGTTCPDGICNEALQNCTECSADNECGPVLKSLWSPCDFGSDFCSITGTQQQTITTPTCSNNSCLQVVTTENQSCTRPNPTEKCKPDEFNWTTCDYWQDCDQTAERKKSVTTYGCNAGTCKATTLHNVETEICSRNTNGNVCSAGGYSGTCINECCDAPCPPGKHCLQCFLTE